MKRILAVICLLMIFCGCTELRNNSVEESESEGVENSEKIQSELKGIWIPIYDAAPRGKNENEYKKAVDEMMKNISSFGLTDVFYQVRANCDSVYPSDIFKPCYMYAVNGSLGFDALKIMVDCAHKYDISLHAWINPYRICSDKKTQPENIPEGIKKKDYFESSGGLYLNPCSGSVLKIVLDGVREIIENYDVDGIHIDDYFYPAQGEEIDRNEYEKYIKCGGKSTLSEFRRENVSLLVSSIYSLVKSKDKNIVFSISPGGSIEKDSNNLYADVKKWCAEEGYCDIIIPQIYFGFENESLPFRETFEKWKSIKSDKIKICPGLSVYKSGKKDMYAGEGKNEWIYHSDIIKRQVEYLRENESDGFVLFSYSYVFGNINFTNEEVQNLKSVI